ncbi:NAD(P)-binding protein [Fistulina hepatica ATCC 64428]|nr:NAD(P)-binding protein [Fistulina hepatica ATCC 64428]
MLAECGASVVVVDLHLPAAAEQENAKKIHFYQCDVSKWENVKIMAERVSKEIGDPTIIINNAGVVQGKLILDLLPSEIERTFNVNTLAHFWIIKAFLPAMLSRKSGHIVSVASVMGITSAAQVADYCASKAAVISLMKSLRYELDKRYACPKIRTTTVCPGHITTRMFGDVVLPCSSLLRFAVPSVTPEDVAGRVVTGLEAQVSQTIMVPFYAHLTPFTELLPSFARDFVQWDFQLSGADWAMASRSSDSERRT